MTNKVEVVQTTRFKKSVKKLKTNQKRDLDQAIREILNDPLLGELKKGDLRELRVYKFKMVNQLTLLGYEYAEGKLLLTLIMVSSHENFYRDLKRQM